MKKSETVAVLRGRIRQLDSDIEGTDRQHGAAWAGNWKSFVHYAKIEREAIQMAITVLDEDGMKLPDGKTTETCIHFPVCGTIFGCEKGNIKCDFSPCRYVENVLHTDYGVFGCTTCTHPCVAWTGAIPPNRCIRNDLDCQDNAKWVMLKPVDEEAIHGLRFQKEI